MHQTRWAASPMWWTAKTRKSSIGMNMMHGATLHFVKKKYQTAFFFNGQQYDQTNRQYYLRARYYNPVIARFTQEDTYRGDGLNLYAYCANNLVSYVDPSGHVQRAYGGVRTTNLAHESHETVTAGEGRRAGDNRGGTEFREKSNSYRKYDSKEIEKKYRLKKGEYHRKIKRDIISDLKRKDSLYRDSMKKIGNNPDIYLSPEGQIEIVSTQFKGKSFITDLNINDFLS